MILVKTDKHGQSFCIAEGNHSDVLDALNNEIEKLENNNIFLIEEGDGEYEFADKDGWNCVLLFADDQINKVKC